MRVRLLTFLALVLFSSSVWAQGYSIEGNRIVVDTKDHWMDWKFPEDVVDISDNGQVSPAYIRKNINASLDAHKFVHDKDIRGGIRDAGSNLGDAPNIMDGDMDTWWEPDKGDSLGNWWVDMDLGRLVAATKIVVRFVEEGQGDPS